MEAHRTLTRRTRVPLNSGFVKCKTGTIQRGFPQIEFIIMNHMMKTAPAFLNEHEQRPLHYPVLRRFIQLSVGEPSLKFNAAVYDSFKDDAEMTQGLHARDEAREKLRQALQTNKEHAQSIPAIHKAINGIQEIERRMGRQRESSAFAHAKTQLQTILDELLKTHPFPHSEEQLAAFRTAVDDMDTRLDQLHDARRTPEAIQTILAQYLRAKRFPDNSLEQIDSAVIALLVKKRMSLYELEESNNEIDMSHGERPLVQGTYLNDQRSFPLNFLLDALRPSRSGSFIVDKHRRHFVFAPTGDGTNDFSWENIPAVIIGDHRHKWACILTDAMLADIIVNDDELRSSPWTTWFMQRHPHPTHPGFANASPREPSPQTSSNTSTTSDDEEEDEEDDDEVLELDEPSRRSESNHLT